MMACGGAILPELGDHIEFFGAGDDWGARCPAPSQLNVPGNEDTAGPIFLLVII